MGFAKSEEIKNIKSGTKDILFFQNFPYIISHMPASTEQAARFFKTGMTCKKAPGYYSILHFQIA